MPELFAFRKKKYKTIENYFNFSLSEINSEEKNHMNS